MTVSFYMDHHVPSSITIGLRQREVDVLTAYEDGTHQWTDPDLLDRAGKLERVLFTQDDDLLAEAARRQKYGLFFMVLFMLISNVYPLVFVFKIWN